MHTASRSHIIGDTMTDKILKPILIILIALNVLDYGFTMRAVYALNIPEANPFMDLALGSPLFALIKLVIVPAMCYIIWVTRESWQQRLLIGGLLGFVLLAYSGVTVWHFYGQFLM